MAGSREAAEPDNVADATGNADGHGLELILLMLVDNSPAEAAPAAGQMIPEP